MRAAMFAISNGRFETLADLADRDPAAGVAALQAAHIPAADQTLRRLTNDDRTGEARVMDVIFAP